MRTKLRKINQTVQEKYVPEDKHNLVERDNTTDEGKIELELDNTWNYAYIATLYIGTPS